MSAVFKAGHTAVITGGASGIGLALAKKCHGYGMTVLVADWNEDSLKAVTEKVGDKVVTLKMDVSLVVDWARLKDIVDKELNGQINLLALNAGVGPKSGWDNLESFHKTFSTNVFGVVNGIHTLLPLVQQTASVPSSAPAAIVITGSKQGITNPPGNPAYNASKSAVRTLAEHLSWDLRGSHPGVAVHLLVPGWTFTGLTGSSAAKEKPAGAWWPEQVVDYLEQKMGAGEFYVLCPDNDVTEALDRRRMLWGAGDAVEGRPPLTRWRDDWKDKAKAWIEGGEQQS